MRNKNSNNLSSKLKQEFLSFSQLNLSNSIAPIFFSLLYKKIEKTPLRANFAVHIYEYLKSQGGKKNNISKVFFTQQFPFILEAIITIQYYHNQIIDGKAGVVDNFSISNNLILGNLLKEQLYRYINQLDIPKKIRKKLAKSVREVFECVDVGQYLEKNHCSYDAFQEKRLIHPFQTRVKEKIEEAIINEVIDIIHRFTPLDQAPYQDFLRLYLEKIYMMNGVLFRFGAEFLAEVMQVREDTIKKVMEFATYFGMAQQIINDNCDFVPSIYHEATVGKTCGDAFSDLKNRSVTLPILIHFTQSENEKILNYINTEEARLREMDFFKEITQAFSIYFSMTVGKRIKSNGLSCLELDMNVNKNRRIQELCFLAGNNRFYKYFYALNRGKCYNTYKKRFRR